MYRAIWLLVSLIVVAVVACSDSSLESNQTSDSAPVPSAGDVPGPSGTIQVHYSWARATMTPGQPGVVYFEIENRSDQNDVLLGASTPVADMALMHGHVPEGEIAKMIRLKSIAVPLGKKVSFARGGNHIMLMGLKEPLVDSTQFQMTLHFRNAGDVAIPVTVHSLGNEP